MAVTQDSVKLFGSDKTVEHWKKCWVDLNCGVKKNVNARRKFINQTGGGSWVDIPRDLNSMEEQILQIITIDAVDGDACTPETGVPMEASFERYLSIEFLESEDMCTQTSTKASHTAGKKFTSAALKGTSKYAEYLDEARNMQKALENRKTK